MAKVVLLDTFCCLFAESCPVEDDKKSEVTALAKLFDRSDNSLTTFTLWDQILHFDIYY